MGYNTKTFDSETYYRNKSTKQLEVTVKSLEKTLQENPDHLGRVFLNEHLGCLKMLIAERIGK